MNDPIVCEEIDPQDLRIDTCSFDPTVRITHIPTGTVAEAENREAAMEILKEKIQKKK